MNIWDNHLAKSVYSTTGDSTIEYWTAINESNLNWQHIAVVKKNNNVDVYVDGKRQPPSLQLELDCHNTTFLGIDRYVVDVKGVRAMNDLQLMHDMIDWCVATLDGFYVEEHNRRFIFQNEKDRAWFVLKWG